VTGPSLAGTLTAARDATLLPILGTDRGVPEQRASRLREHGR
jgi:hypothetical protein